MTREELFSQIKKKESYLCVGLDSDIEKIPHHLHSADDPVFEFNKQIIDTTIDYAVAYKPNLAFYESRGAAGWESLAKTLEYIPKEIFTIADAKRGDIGNTSKHYARAFFEQMDFDAITLSPYMGEDAVTPYLEYDDKWAIVLALTSNESSQDFEELFVSEGDFDNENPKLYESIITKSQQWQNSDRIMYVVGATKATAFEEIRKLSPDSFYLVPGVGAQGGSLQEVSQYGMNSECGLLVNSSRGIIFASSDTEFAKIAGQKAAEIRDEMKGYLDKYCH
ncbi:MAG: orotidine-5'-phosphate decarboxylase [Bacteroidota bacterium]